MSSEASFVNFLQIGVIRKIMSSYPIKLDNENNDHIKVFRKILEWSMTQGRWNGWVAEES